MTSRSTIKLFTCVLVLAGCRSTFHTQHTVRTEAETHVPKIYPCHYARGKIKIDGLINEPDWQQAKTVDFVTVARDGRSFGPARSPTSAKLTYDKNHLYIAIEACDKDIWATFTDRDDDLWYEDVLEAFFKPDDTKPTYYEFEFSPRNVVLDLIIPRRGARTLRAMKQFDAPVKSAVKVRGTLDNWKDIDDKWVLEAAIPLSAFKDTTATPEPGDKWRFALCRYDYSFYLQRGKEMSSSAEIPRMDFHGWQYYDILLFQE